MANSNVRNLLAKIERMKDDNRLILSALNLASAKLVEADTNIPEDQREIASIEVAGTFIQLAKKLT